MVDYKDTPQYLAHKFRAAEKAQKEFDALVAIYRESGHSLEQAIAKAKTQTEAKSGSF